MKNQYEIDYQQGYDKANDEWLERIGKIRAEIEQLHLIGYATIDGKREIASRAVMQILDKYKDLKGEKK